MASAVQIEPMRPPLVRSWDGPANPLPVRPVRAAGAGDLRSLDRRGQDTRAERETRAERDPCRLLGLEAPPWHVTGPAGEPFDFCAHVERLCADVCLRCPVLRHVEVSRLLVAVTQARNGNRHGLQARVTPLRFRGGRLTRQRHGVTYQVQRYLVGDREVLYVVAFCLPRFLDLDFDEKLITLFHELYHINPAFDGDLRHHGGRCSVHSRSKRQYDRYMAQLAREYLAGGADPALHAFLRLNFAQLRHRHGDVVGVMVPRPKIVPVPGPCA